MKTAAVLVLIIQTLFLTAVAGLLLHLLLPDVVAVGHVLGAMCLLPLAVAAGFLFITAPAGE